MREFLDGAPSPLPFGATGPVTCEVDLDWLRDEILAANARVIDPAKVEAYNEKVEAANQRRAKALIANNTEVDFGALSLASVHGFQSLRLDALGSPNHNWGYFKQGQGQIRRSLNVQPDGALVQIAHKHLGDQQRQIIESLIFTPATEFVTCGTRRLGQNVGWSRRQILQPRLEPRPLIDPITKEPLIEVGFRYHSPELFSNLTYKSRDLRRGDFSWNMLLKQSLATHLLAATKANPRFIHQVTDDLAYNLTRTHDALMTMDDWEQGARRQGYPIRPPFEARIASGSPLHIFDGFSESRTPISNYIDDLRQQYPRISFPANEFDKTYAYSAV